MITLWVQKRTADQCSDYWDAKYVFINNYAVTQMCLFTFTYDYFEHVFHVTYIRIVFTILYFVIRTLNLCVWLPYDTVILKSKMLFFRRKNDAIFSGVGVKNCTPPLPKKSIFPLSAFLESRETKHLFLFLMIYFALQCIVWLYIQYSTVQYCIYAKSTSVQCSVHK